MKSSISVFSNNKDESPLVSIIVITYNFASTVIETLESVKAQSFDNIELVVSDDCSKDNTVELCTKWLKANSGRFVKSQIVTTDTNTGVAANLNRGIKASCGKWVKAFAGDDILKPNAICSYVHFMNNDKSMKICVCDVELFTSSGSVPKQEIEAYQHFLELEKEPYDLQYQRVLRKLIFVGPGYFFSRELYDEVGGFNEKYRFCEEWPFIYGILKLGYRINVLEEKLVCYRISNNSLSRKRKGGNYILFKNAFDFYKDVLFKELLQNDKLDAIKFYLYYKIVYVYCKVRSKGLINYFKS